MSVKAKQKSNKNEQSRTVSGIVEQSQTKSKTDIVRLKKSKSDIVWLKIQKRTSFDHFGRIMSQTPQPGEAKLCLLWIVFIDKLQKKSSCDFFSFVLVFYQFFVGDKKNAELYETFMRSLCKCKVILFAPNILPQLSKNYSRGKLK